jgi:hypothetical protein
MTSGPVDLRQRAKGTTSQVRRQTVTAGEAGRAHVSEAAVVVVHWWIRR